MVGVVVVVDGVVVVVVVVLLVVVVLWPYLTVVLPYEKERLYTTISQNWSPHKQLSGSIPQRPKAVSCTMPS